MKILPGDIVTFKNVYKIDISDLISSKFYTKYMIVISIVNVDEKTACKVMCGNGEINWVALSRIEKVV